jgi:AcrR family transcriptional regulator
MCMSSLSRVRKGGSLRYSVSLANHSASILVSTYTRVMPRLWNETIETHRREVRDAILETTVALVAEHGLRSVTMSRIAEKAGIGRATLYKYFPGVEAILHAWHERQITGHLDHLAEVRGHAGNPRERLEAVLEAYALISHESRGHRDTELAALMHRDGQVARAEQQLRRMIRDLITEGQKSVDVRDDVTPDELVSYCLHALTAASGLPSKAAVRRLVAVTLAGLHSPA